MDGDANFGWKKPSCLTQSAVWSSSSLLSATCGESYGTKTLVDLLTALCYV